MRTFDLRPLFREQRAGAYLHDSPLDKITIDYIKREVTLSCTLWIALSDDFSIPEESARGEITFTGMKYFVAQTPDEHYNYDDPKGLDIVSHGSLSLKEMQEKYPELPRDLDDDDFVYYFYATNFNSSVVVAANDAHFKWIE